MASHCPSFSRLPAQRLPIPGPTSGFCHCLLLVLSGLCSLPPQTKEQYRASGMCEWLWGIAVNSPGVPSFPMPGLSVGDCFFVFLWEADFLPSLLNWVVM